MGAGARVGRGAGCGEDGDGGVVVAPARVMEGGVGVGAEGIGIEAGGKTIIPGDEIEVDFASGIVTFRGSTFRFPPLGSVPQSLVVAGGVENQVRQRLGSR